MLDRDLAELYDTLSSTNGTDIQAQSEQFMSGPAFSDIAEAEKTGAVVFHAGTKLDNSGQLVTAGGRVLGVTAKGKTLRDAVNNAYAAVKCISWDGVEYRTDIAHRAFEHL